MTANFRNPVNQWVPQPGNPNVFYIPLPDNVFYDAITGAITVPGQFPGSPGGAPSSSSSSGPPPKRYLRMKQRDDGLGIERHPRIPSVGNSTSVHSRVPRLGIHNRYQ